MSDEYLSLFIIAEVYVNFKSLFSPESRKYSTPSGNRLFPVGFHLLCQGNSFQLSPSSSPTSLVFLGGCNSFPSHCNDSRVEAVGTYSETPFPNKAAR